MDNYNNLIANLNTRATGNEAEIQKRIAKAEIEMLLHGIDDISEVWARNFLEKQTYIWRDIDAGMVIGRMEDSDIFNENVNHIPPAGSRLTWKVRISIAAALVFSLLLFKSLIPSYSGDSVYKNYYEPLEANSFTLRGNSQDVNSKLQEGFNYYLSKDYARAELAFSDLRNTNENRPEILLFSGLNQMEQQNYVAAINLFNDLISAEDQFIPEAQWYLGLCYIRTGDNMRARSIMKTLSETEGLYKKKAQFILNNLK